MSSELDTFRLLLRLVSWIDVLGAVSLTAASITGTPQVLMGVKGPNGLLLTLDPQITPIVVSFRSPDYALGTPAP